MSNYTKTTNFTAKDNLPSGNTAKKVVGSEFDTEFNNISTAIATKADTTALATKADITGTAFTGNISTSGTLNVAGITQLAANISVVDDILLVGTSPTFQCHNSYATPAASAVLGTVSFGTIGASQELPKTATIAGVATSQWSTGVAPTDIVLSTTAAASGSTLTERMRITADDGIKVTTLAGNQKALQLYNGSNLAGKITTGYASPQGFFSIGQGSTGLRFINYTQKNIAPFNVDTNADSDNLVDLGKVAARFDDIYATNGTIQTSDQNEKQDIEELTEAETRVAVACKGLLRKFRWKSSVEAKGDEARTHFGIIAQDLQAAFAAEGLDAGDYAMFTSSTWTNDEGEEQTRLGVRYSELLAFIIGGI
jgi:hypothetical protein